MKNLFRSKKALSPVVAAIILIAVTVAVSIAVAAWMGALTFTFMATEQVSITGVRYTSATALIINITNTGSSKVTINAVEISGNPAASMTVSWSSDSSTTGNELNPGERAALTVTSSSSFTAGVSYEFVVITMGGNRFGPYVKTYSG